MILGIDIGGTKVALALADDAGQLSARARLAMPQTGDPSQDMALVIDEAKALIAEADIAPDALDRVGVSVPGPIDRPTGRVLHPPNLRGWKDVPVGQWIADAFDCPVHLENDANAGALAEWHHGAGRGTTDFAYLTMSTGVGGGLVLGGRLHRGHAGTAGELGHVPVEPGGARCACGRRGCLEAYVGGAAWARRLRAEAPASSLVVELAGDVSRITTHHVIEAARAGDAYALREVDRFNEILARALVWLTYALTPEVIALGTLVVAAGEELVLEPLRARLREAVWPHQAPFMRIEAAELGDDVGYWAGICAALDPGDS